MPNVSLPPVKAVSSKSSENLIKDFKPRPYGMVPYLFNAGAVECMGVAADRWSSRREEPGEVD